MSSNLSIKFNMSRLITGLYKHYKGKQYNVIGVGRSTDNPMKQFVVYEQLYDNKIENTDIDLPKGSLWIRELYEFNGYVDKTDTIKRFTKI